MKSSEMYNIRANENYKCVCEGSGTTIYLCLVLVDKGEERKQKVKKVLIEGVKLVIAMLIGMFVFICLEGRLPVF